jgi:hypothetical protein
MKRNLFLLLIAALVITLAPACHKGGGGSGEATLAVTLTPPNGSTQAPAPGPTGILAVQVTSTLPASGVKIDVTAKIDGSSGSPFFTTSVNSTQALTNISITGTPSTVISLVNVTVTSLSTSSNVWTGSYRYSSK